MTRHNMGKKVDIFGGIVLLKKPINLFITNTNNTINRDIFLDISYTPEAHTTVHSDRLQRVVNGLLLQGNIGGKKMVFTPLNSK